MDGTVKYFNRDRGFGFIQVSGETDRFFHVSQLRDREPPNVGDSVSFEAAVGKDGRPIAAHVQITERKPAHPRTTYYANPTYRTVTDNTTPFAQNAVGGGIGGVIGLLIGGPIGGTIGMGVGSALADNKKQEEITSTCIRCGGVGHTTATVGVLTGFQCEKCHHFWKERTAK
jgi:cold shock CspA family protein